MGCLKLDILDTQFIQLKVVYKKGNGCEKVMQGFISVDPLASMFSSTSPYVYTLNKPLKYIDPTGIG